MDGERWMEEDGRRKLSERGWMEEDGLRRMDGGG